MTVRDPSKRRERGRGITTLDARNDASGRRAPRLAPVRWFAAVYRGLLLFYPTEFRATAGHDLVDAFRARLIEAGRHGIVFMARYAFREIRDLAVNAGPEWRESDPRRASRGAPPTWRSVQMLDNSIQDVRHAGRSLLRRPVLSVVIVSTLALGIGANATLFGVVNGVLLEPLPYRDPERLVYMNESFRQTQTKSVSYLNYLDWRRLNTSFEDLGARTFWSYNLTGRGEATELRAMLLSANVLDILGVQPVLGRGFSPEEERTEAPVVLLSHGLWQTRFGADRDIVGSSLILDDVPYTVLGVMPAGLDYPLAGVELWAPITELSDNDQNNRGSHPGIGVIGRLREGVSREQAQIDMDAVAARLAAQYPDSNTEAGVNLRPLHERYVGRARPILWLILMAVALVLLIACANVANLLLARTAERGHDLAVRNALGAGAGRLIRQLLTESLLLSVVAGGLGTAGAYWGVAAFRSLQPADLPRLERVAVDGQVLLFALAVSIVTGLLFGALPALRAAATAPAEALKDGGGRSGSAAGNRVRAGLIVAEVAVAFVLLVGAGLMVRSVANLVSADPGLDPAGMLTGYVPLPQPKYPDNADRALAYRRLLERLTALPGVEAAGGVDPLPMSGSDRQWTISSEGFETLLDDNGLRADQANATPGYFETMGIPLLAGRGFVEGEGAVRPVAVVDETLAHRLWPGLELVDVVGKRLKFRGDDNPWLEVVGVAGHVKNYGVKAESRVQIYIPYDFNVWGLHVVLRTGADPVTLAPAVRRELAAIDPNVPLTRVNTMQSLVAASIAPETLVTRMLAAFSAASVFMALLGLYGIIAYSVSQRTREIGIRKALGARDREILGRIVREGLVMVALGIAIGAAAALSATRLLAGLLFGVGPADLSTLFGMAVSMLLVATAATLLPARRALRVDPTVALRSEV